LLQYISGEDQRILALGYNNPLRTKLRLLERQQHRVFPILRELVRDTRPKTVHTHILSKSIKNNPTYYSRLGKLSTSKPMLLDFIWFYY
jgi:hypothetical protein